MSTEHVIHGIHQPLKITSAPASVLDSLKGQTLIGAGLLNVAGVYECRVDTRGISDVEVNIKPTATAVVGSFAPTLASYYFDDSTTKSTSAGANFVASTLQTLTIATLKGVRSIKLTFTIPGGGSVTFAQAEVNGL
jgi:hypothetical protein